MPVIPNALERLLLLRLNQGPGALVDLLGAGAFRAAGAGLSLGIFETLRRRALTPAEVAAESKADERAITLLLEVLEASGYVKACHDRYANTPAIAKLITSGSSRPSSHRK